MKKYLVGLLFLLASTVHAGEPATFNRSSFTATSDNGRYIEASYLDKVVVGVATAGGTLVIYNSTWTASVVISSISLAAAMTHDFSNTAIKGIWYVSNAATNGVTILYKK